MIIRNSILSTGGQYKELIFDGDKKSFFEMMNGKRLITFRQISYDVGKKNQYVLINPDFIVSLEIDDDVYQRW